MGTRSKRAKKLRRAYRRKCDRAGIPYLRTKVRSQRPKRSILDLIFLPPFLILEELCNRARTWLWRKWRVR